MAHKYVWSAAAGAGTGANWANAYLTIKAAAEAAGTAAGDSIWVAHDHVETGAATLTISPKNTAAVPGTIACVNRAGSVPPVAADLRTTATVTTTGNSPINIAGITGGPTLWQGITFNYGSGAVGAYISLGTVVGQFNYFKNCTFKKLGTTVATFAVSVIGQTRLDSCQVQFGHVGDGITLYTNRMEWLNTPNAIAGATIPTLLLVIGNSAVETFIHGVDLSAITATLMQGNGAATHDIRLVNCKLAAGVTMIGAQTISYGSRLTVVGCDSGATAHRNERYMYGGAQTTETTIVRTGGASDGTTPVSWKVATDANPRWQVPFESLPITVWNDSPGAKTVSVYGYWNNASVPNNDEIWIEVEGLADASFPISSIASSGKASFLATNTVIPSDASAWGGGVTTSKFKMSAAITTAMRGPISVIVKAAKASSTFYIDPKIEVT